MNRTDTIAAYALLLLALVICGAVVWFQSVIVAAEAAYVSDTQTMAQQVTQRSSSQSLHAIAQNTAPERQRLDALLAPDVAAIAAMLRGIGKSTGARVTLGGAVPVSAPAGTGSAVAQAVAFTLSADGSFNALVRTEALIETLPLPSSVERFDIQRGQESDAWHLDIAIRVLTSSTLTP